MDVKGVTEPKYACTGAHSRQGRLDASERDACKCWMAWQSATTIDEKKIHSADPPNSLRSSEPSTIARLRPGHITAE